MIRRSTVLRMVAALLFLLPATACGTDDVVTEVVTERVVVTEQQTVAEAPPSDDGTTDDAGDDDGSGADGGSPFPRTRRATGVRRAASR